MDILTQAEVTLREAGYETWVWTAGPVPAVCFENSAIIGFLHVFETGSSLLQRWEHAQQVVLARYAPALRAAGEKAWNVYSVFLTGDSSPSLLRQIERVEEDFALSRKIARGGIQTTLDLTRGLLPLLPVKSQPTPTSTDYMTQLRARLRDVPPDAVTAFLGQISAASVAMILRDLS